MRLIPAKVVSEFEKVVGKESVFTDPSRLSIYSRGSIDNHGHFPEIGIQVRSVSQASEVMRIANSNRIPVVVRGGGSSPTGAVVPHRGGIVLDMKGMNSIKVSIENGYVEAEAGATLADVDRECRKYGFFFPPDPSSVSVATVGGAINENSGGMRCAKYGVMKDWILKIGAVMPDGLVTSFGEATYKNRAGYNLVGIITGSEGTLCIVTKAWLKIMPIPENTVRIAAFFNSLEDAGEAIYRIRRDGVNPLILEYADRFGIQAANELKDWHFPVADGGMVLVDLEMTGEDRKGRISRVIEIFKQTSSSKIIVPEGNDEADNLFEIRRIAFAAPGKLFSGFIDGDIAVPLSRIKDAILGVEKIRKELGVYIATCGHVGDGNLHPQVGGDISNDEEWSRAMRAAERINLLAIELGGSVSGEHGIGTQKEDLFEKQLMERGQEITLDIMRQIKRIFDPNNIMNPDKFALGEKRGGNGKG